MISGALCVFAHAAFSISLSVNRYGVGYAYEGAKAAEELVNVVACLRCWPWQLLSPGGMFLRAEAGSGPLGWKPENRFDRFQLPKKRPFGRLTADLQP